MSGGAASGVPRGRGAGAGDGPGRGAGAPLVLALDTATRQATAAVCRGAQVLAEDAREVTTHSEGLLPLLDEVLRLAGLSVRDLHGVVCGVGPGSFTGLRIGLATAKGLCLAAGLPLVGVSSLLPLALACGGGEDRWVAAVLDARRGEVFCEVYRGAAPAGAVGGGLPEALGPTLLARPEDLPGRLTALCGAAPLVLAGDGALRYEELLLPRLGAGCRLAPPGGHEIRARYLAQAAGPRLAAGEADDLQELVPRYVRAADARLPGGATPA